MLKCDFLGDFQTLCLKDFCIVHQVMYVWAIDKSAAASNYHCKIKSNGWLARSLAVSQSIFQIAMPWPLSFQYVYVCAKRAQKVQIQERNLRQRSELPKEAPDQKQKLGYVKRTKNSRAAKAEGLRRREKSPPNFSFSLYENDSHKMAQPKVWPSTLV